MGLNLDLVSEKTNYLHITYKTSQRSGNVDIQIGSSLWNS